MLEIELITVEDVDEMFCSPGPCVVNNGGDPDAD